ncbi:triose-phosphate isomerase [Flavimaricola marinus]|uniref:Triosephosphate isomerase n=1 Tax=Flavimaricola marinus TaxID=1819565 RepID=A0A238LDV8_9RHOB|nr:triose-phosphate isomerase [Flavimaricola marinus]SMY07869.1 Triosephosphate isomerase [Flavimaricola marinus]
MAKKLAAGNWKMNGTSESLSEIAALIAAHPNPSVDVLLCPPATLIAAASTAKGSHALGLGGQDCHANVSGAHTGDLSAQMLKDAGASYVIVGHSERRTDHGETSDLVRAKAEAATQAGLTAIICIGETLAQREAGETLAILDEQLQASVPDSATAATTVIAYEPVWAIGTGLTPTEAQIGEVHAALHSALGQRFGDGGDFSLLYGGSVKGSNAAQIFAIPHVHGALVGGASLKAADFSPIVTALEQA